MSLKNQYNEAVEKGDVSAAVAVFKAARQNKENLNDFNINARTRAGLTLVHRATMERHSALLPELQRLGADFDLLTPSGQTAFQLAIDNNDRNSAVFIARKAGADLSLCLPKKSFMYRSLTKT